MAAGVGKTQRTGTLQVSAFVMPAIVSFQSKSPGEARTALGGASASARAPGGSDGLRLTGHEPQ